MYFLLKDLIRILVEHFMNVNLLMRKIFTIYTILII